MLPPDTRDLVWLLLFLVYAPPFSVSCMYCALSYRTGCADRLDHWADFVSLCHVAARYYLLGRYRFEGVCRLPGVSKMIKSPLHPDHWPGGPVDHDPPLVLT